MLRFLLWCVSLLIGSLRQPLSKLLPLIFVDSFKVKIFRFIRMKFYWFITVEMNKIFLNWNSLTIWTCTLEISSVQALAFNVFPSLPLNISIELSGVNNFGSECVFLDFIATIFACRCIWLCGLYQNLINHLKQIINLRNDYNKIKIEK